MIIKIRMYFSSYLLKSCDVWHYRLSCVNYNSIQRLINHELLPRIIFEKKNISVKFV
jgi:hypothetical protein